MKFDRLVFTAANLPHAQEALEESTAECANNPIENADVFVALGGDMVTVAESQDKTLTLLFDAEHNLEERILSEQFLP